MEKAFADVLKSLADVISKLLRSLDDKQQRLDALNTMKNQPTGQILKMVNQTAIENEDYETCEALKIFSEQKGFKL